jgi:hypothetical protein
MVRIGNVVSWLLKHIFRLLRLLIELWFIIFFIHHYFLIANNPDGFHGIEIDSKNENIYFIASIKNNMYLGAYSLSNGFVSILAQAPEGKHWMKPTLSPFNDEIAFSELDIKQSRNGTIKIFNLDSRAFTDSLIDFPAIPVTSIFHDGSDHILFTATILDKRGSPVSKNTPRGFDVYDYNRLNRTVYKITNRNAHQLNYLNNFKGDSLIITERKSGTLWYKFSRKQSDSFYPVNDEGGEKYRYDFSHQNYCDQKNKIYFLWWYKIFEMDADLLIKTFLFDINCGPNGVDDIEITNNCEILLYSLTNDINRVYRYNLEKKEIMLPIELKYPSSLID